MSKRSSLNNYFNRDNSVNAITNAPGAASSLTIAGWYYASAFGNVHQPLSIGTNDFDFLFVIEVDTGGNVRAYTAKSSTAQTNNTASTALSTGTWYHFAATWNGSTVRLYVNGAETANVSGTITSQQAVTYIEQGYVNGGADELTMQDLCYFSAALSADEVRELSVGRLPKRRTNLVVHWPLFAKSGNAQDFSGNGNDGIQNGTVADGTVDAPTGWATSSPRFYRPATTTVSFSSGVSDSTTAATGTLRVRIPFTSGALTSNTSAVGTLRNRVLFTSGLSSSTTAASATLRVRIPFTAGSSVSVTSATGTLHTRVLFTSGTLTSPSDATATLQVRKTTAGVATTTTAAVGTLATHKLFTTAASNTNSSAVGETSTFGDKMFDSGTSTTTSQATGTLRVEAPFTTATAATTSAAIGTLGAESHLAGVATSTTAAVATLRVKKRFTTAFCFSHTAARGEQTGGTAHGGGGREYTAQRRRFGGLGLRRKIR